MARFKAFFFLFLLPSADSFEEEPEGSGAGEGMIRGSPRAEEVAAKDT